MDGPSMYQGALRGTKRPTSLLARYETELSRLTDRGLAGLALTRGRELERIDALMRNIVQQSFDGVIAFADNGQVVVANAAAEMMFGRSLSGAPDCSFDVLFPHFDQFQRTDMDMSDGTNGRWEGWAERIDRTVFPVELALRQVSFEGGQQLVAVVRDITQAKEQERQLREQATHDALTGLANRMLLHERLDEALHEAARRSVSLALLLLDLDRFKEVNDTLGHHVGDRLLQELAHRLCCCVRPGDMVARLGGDEFAVLLPCGSDLAVALEVGERIASIVRDPFALSDAIVVEVGVSIGIATVPEHANEAAKLLQAADVAMYAAKANGTSVAVYNRASDHNSLRHLTLTGALRRAIEHGELAMHYQPKVCLRTGETHGCEALVRWEHPQFGSMSPDEFVPHAERTGLIHSLMVWTLDTALAQIALLGTHGFHLSVAVNISPTSLQDRGLHQLVLAALARHQVDPRLLILELTERAMLRDPRSATEILGRLHAEGVKLSVDDFGTGYSSLALLQKLAVDEIKIDRSFIARMAEDPSDLVLVRSTIDLAHNLGLQTVAEGIEQKAQLDLLRQHRCDVGQGFLFASALTGAQFAQWLRTRSHSLIDGAINPGARHFPEFAPSIQAKGANHIPSGMPDAAAAASWTLQEAFRLSEPELGSMPGRGDSLLGV